MQDSEPPERPPNDATLTEIWQWMDEYEDWALAEGAKEGAHRRKDDESSE